MHIHRRLKLVGQAIVPIVAGAAIAISAVVSHDASVQRDRQAQADIKVACAAAHDTGTSILNGVLKIDPRPETKTAVAKLQDGVDTTYKTCLRGVKP